MERLRRTDFQPGKIRMRGIEQMIEFPRDDGAWHPQSDAALAPRPGAAKSLSRRGIRIGPPRWGIPRWKFDRCAWKRNGRRLPIDRAQVLNVLDMKQGFQGCQRSGFRAINDPRSREIPAPSVPPRPVAGESSRGKTPAIETPDRDGVRHEKTPSSKRPRTASTSRAPGSVRARSSGVRPASTRSGRFSQRRVRSFVPKVLLARS